MGRHGPPLFVVTLILTDLRTNRHNEIHEYNIMPSILAASPFISCVAIVSPSVHSYLSFSATFAMPQSLVICCSLISLRKFSDFDINCLKYLKHFSSTWMNTPCLDIIDIFLWSGVSIVCILQLWKADLLTLFRMIMALWKETMGKFLLKLMRATAQSRPMWGKAENGKQPIHSLFKWEEQIGCTNFDLSFLPSLNYIR